MEACVVPRSEYKINNIRMCADSKLTPCIRAKYQLWATPLSQVLQHKDRCQKHSRLMSLAIPVVECCAVTRSERKVNHIRRLIP